MRVVIVIATYEPQFIHHPELERFYTGNFDSFLGAQGDLDVKLVITDFASSKSFKAFLRNYVSDRPGCWLIDGEQEASLHVAINIALRNFEYDYWVFAACDLRARDGRWLEILLGEFDDPKVQIAVPTVTKDGTDCCQQNQAGPIDRESRPVGLHEYFGNHCAVFSHRFFNHFGGRYPDIFDCHHTEYCLMYQLAGLGYIAKVNFRVNLVHGDREVLWSKPGEAPDGWRKRNDLPEADHRKFLSRTAHLPDFIASSGLSLPRKIRIHLETLKTQGWRYFYFRLFSRRALADFCSLDMPTKEAIMLALFYRTLSDYQKYAYSIYSSNADDAGAAGASATPEIVRG